MDADIALPPLTRRLLELCALDPAALYGCDRFMVRSFEEWMRFKCKPRLQHENESWIHMNEFPLGVRVAIHNYGGYIPIGFFQMWNPKVSGVSKYPEGHTTAAREDSAFTLDWPRSRRALLPEIIAYHLESENAPMAANWAGRKTARFGL